MSQYTKSKIQSLGPLQAKVLQALSDQPKFYEEIRLKLGRKQSYNEIRRALLKLEKLRLAKRSVLLEAKKKRRIAWSRREVGGGQS